MPNFKKLNTKIYQKSGPVVTPDYVYWKQLAAPVLVKEFGPIDYIDFSPIEPYHFAVTCSVRVQVYNPVTKLVVKNLSRFRENAYGAVFRSDGRLICAGGEETNVKLFDVSTKSLLRLFKGHQAPVHRTHFLHNQPRIASFSDDKTVKIWDIPTEKTLTTYDSHTDYVRAGAMCLAMPDIVLSGGYDGKVKIYDTRTESEVLTADHGSAVESVLFLPSGGIFLSAGGTDIKIWDVLAGGKLLGSLSQHHKTITCLHLASDNKRLLSGSLDRHVKIYDLATFKPVHTLTYPNAILSLAVSKNDDTVVAGLVDGLVSISRRDKVEKTIISNRAIDTNKHVVPSVDVIVEEQSKEKETKFDHHLRKFEFAKALDCVLVPYVANKRPEVTVSLLRELLRRKALSKALLGRDKKALVPMVRFLVRHVGDPRFSRVLLQAADAVLDACEGGRVPPEVGKLLADLGQAVAREAELAEAQAELQGMMALLMGGQVGRADVEEGSKAAGEMRPSKEAQKSFVLTIT